MKPVLSFNVATETPLVFQFAPEGVEKNEFAKRLSSTIPLGRLAKPEEVAYAALYLASDESSMVTGVALNVDGGRSI